MSTGPALDLEAYLRRIAYDGPLSSTPEGLHALHLAHATHIPFENLDILLGKPIALDPASLQNKLVTGGRGGYCFEHNLLFAEVLAALGFEVRLLAARVRYRAPRLQPRTHMALRVGDGASRWLADVGFGGEGLLLPVPLTAGQPVQQYAWTYRLVREPSQWVLQSLHGAGWVDLYSFTEEPQQPVDYEPVHYYLSTHPESKFRRTLAAQLPGPAVRWVLRNRELIQDTGTRVTRQRLPDDEQLLEVLAERFGLEFPAGTRFAVLDPG